jgi:hypothetical protein
MNNEENFVIGEANGMLALYDRKTGRTYRVSKTHPDGETYLRNLAVNTNELYGQEE